MVGLVVGSNEDEHDEPLKVKLVGLVVGSNQDEHDESQNAKMVKLAINYHITFIFLYS